MELGLRIRELCWMTKGRKGDDVSQTQKMEHGRPLTMREGCRLGVGTSNGTARTPGRTGGSEHLHSPCLPATTWANVKTAPLLKNDRRGLATNDAGFRECEGSFSLYLI